LALVLLLVLVLALLPVPVGQHMQQAVASAAAPIGYEVVAYYQTPSRSGCILTPPQ
jgi:hypothetical protein